MSVRSLPDAASLLCFFCILLVPLASAGLSSINTGLGRSRSAAHSMMAAMSVMAVSALVFFVCGLAWQGFIGGPAHVLNVSGRAWNWIAAEPFFCADSNRISLPRR